MVDDVPPERPVPVIMDEGEAKRRLAVYTLVRLIGLVMLGGGVLLAQDGVGVVAVLLLFTGGASLFVRPRTLARLFGRHW